MVFVRDIRIELFNLEVLRISPFHLHEAPQPLDRVESTRVRRQTNLLELRGVDRRHLGRLVDSEIVEDHHGLSL